MKAILAKKSLCACGFTLMEEHVPLGKVYHIDIYSEEPGYMRCGGCRTFIPVMLVKTLMPDDKTWDDQWIPKECFRFEAPKKRRKKCTRKRSPTPTS